MWVEATVTNSFPEQDGDFISEEDYRKILRMTADNIYEMGRKQKEQKLPITGNDFGWIDELKHDLKHPEELDEKVQEVLKKRQKPAEWSDEDERMRNHKKEGLISAKQNKATKALYNGIEKCYDEKIAWLKSLRPQIIDSAPLYTIEQVDEKIREAQEWKPSEEQMEALNALNCHGDLSYVGQQNQLISLYNDLKKLM